MSDFSVEGAELKKLLNFSRAKPISFAYCPGSKVETDLFGLHKKKPPAVMGKSIRADGDGPKVAFGTLQMEGRVVSLQCEKAMPALAKKVKKFLKLNKLSKNVRILDMDGNVVEEDIEDLPDEPDDDVAADATPQAAPSQAAEPPNRKTPNQPLNLPPRNSLAASDAAKAVGGARQSLAAAGGGGAEPAGRQGTQGICHSSDQLEIRQRRSRRQDLGRD